MHTLESSEASVAVADAPRETARARRRAARAARVAAGISDRPRLFPTLWFGGMHLACLAVLWVGVSWIAVGLCLAFYAFRMWTISSGYHRYFAHRSYSTSRVFRFLIGVSGTLALQKGPLWWASTHRNHHRYSDQPQDVHSPVQRGFWWAHVGWILASKHTATDYKTIRDFARYPELRLVDKFHWVAPTVAGLLLFALGTWLGAAHPSLGTTGPQMLVWGFVISTVLLYHGTWSVNSLVHLLGRRRFSTPDDSRNNMWVALWTFGEGWHNNHHRFPASERQGFYWWEIDLSHTILSLLSRVHLVWDLKRPPKALLLEGRSRS